MKLSFHSQGWEDYQFWQQNDKFILRKLNQLIKDIQRNPFDGIGKPEALSQNLSGYWSRRITQEHRLIYKIIDPEKNGEESEITIAQCRGHYE